MFNSSRSRRSSVATRTTLIALAAAWTLHATPAAADMMTALVPAYFYPSSTDPTYWNELDAAAKQIPVIAIANPDSGPGPSQNSDYVGAIDNLNAAGGGVVGYVYTDYGNRGMADVLADVNAFASFYHINGIFLDQVSTDPAEIPYYQSLYAAIEQAHPGFLIFGNPGTVPPESYVSASPPTADTLTIYENDDQLSPYSAFNPPSWVDNDPANRFDSIVYDVSSAATMEQYVRLAAQRNTGYFYVTDDTLSNPYDTLPSYWDQEVQAIQGLTAIPEPSTLAPAALGVLMALGGYWWQRRRRAVAP
jgi:hypothetical protein